MHGTAAALNHDSPDPLWLQIARLIERDVAGGVLTRGRRLPPERELGRRLGVSRVTLRRALAHLVEEGVLESSQGRGWYVTTGLFGEPPNALRSFTESASARGLEAAARVLAAEVTPAVLEEAEALALAPGAELFRLRRVRLLGGIPIAVDDTRIPLAVAPGLPSVDFAHASLYATLTEHGVRPIRAEYAVEARGADADEAALLEVEPGRPVLVTHQTTVDAAGRPIELSRMTYRGDRYRFRAVLTTTPRKETA